MAKFGLIGQSLSHSFSRQYFTEKFKDKGLSHSYDNYECGNIGDVANLLKDTDVSGFNVTIPYKSAIIPFLNEVDEVALSVGAVNTIVNKGGKLSGYNTDVFGFKQMIKPFFESHHERAIIIGTGGASKAVQYVLEALGSEVIFISRNPKGDNQFGYADMNELMLKACPIVINTTPVGTFPDVDDLVDLPYQFLTSRHLVIDLIYNPTETAFLKQAKAEGATVINGLTMLQQQAEKAWEIWNASLNDL